VKSLLRPPTGDSKRGGRTLRPVAAPGEGGSESRSAMNTPPRSILCLACGERTALLEIGAPPDKCESCKRLLFPDHQVSPRKKAAGRVARARAAHSAKSAGHA